MRLRIFFAILLVSLGSGAQTNKKLSLEDVKIKGDANKDSINLSNRSKLDLSGRIKIRTDFRTEILEHLPDYYLTQPTKK